MAFFPYDANLLRCHPLSAAVTQPFDVWAQKTTRSAAIVEIKCSRCTNTFQGTIYNLCRQTNQCKLHVVENRKSNRPTTSIKLHKFVHEPIRAGLLLCVDHNLLAGVVSQIKEMQADTDGDRLTVALHLIETIRAQYDNVRLADNCFWGSTSSARKHKPVYKHPPNKRPSVDVADVIDGRDRTLVCFVGWGQPPLNVIFILSLNPISLPCMLIKCAHKPVRRVLT
jgi:hypothetical protein